MQRHWEEVGMDKGLGLNTRRDGSCMVMSFRESAKSTLDLNAFLPALAARKNGTDVFGRTVFPDYVIEETEDFYVGEVGLLQCG